MKQQEKNKSTNTKIGRPIKSEKGLEFKKQYQINQIKFELQCQLLVTIHQDYFIEPPLDPHNRRVEINYITALFQKFNCMKAYEVLLKLNEFYYKNSSIFPQDKLRYTSLIDIAYMFKQLRLNMGQKLRCIELVLAVIFFLQYFISQFSNEKLINLNFYEYIETKIQQISIHMLIDPTQSRKKLQKIQMLIITLVLQLAVKEQIKLKR